MNLAQLELFSIGNNDENFKSYLQKLISNAEAVLRGAVDVAEYKYILLGLLFLKCASKIDSLSIPLEADWQYLKTQTGNSAMGESIDNAMIAIERENPHLRGALPKDFARPALGKERLNRLVDLLDTFNLQNGVNHGKDILGDIYEYLLKRFAVAASNKHGEFYTPRCLVELLVRMIEPCQGRIYDPCCGSGGMFLYAAKFARTYALNGKSAPSFYGQELNFNTWQLAKMNLALHGIDGQIANGDTLHEDQFPTLKADFILANPPFNLLKWGVESLRNDKRWQYGVPPAGSANFAWIQHIISHLAPSGVASFISPLPPLFSIQSSERAIRKNIIEAGLVDCIIALPDRLFYSTPIHSAIWIVAHKRQNDRFAERADEILFIEAREMGQMVTRKHRELTEEEVERIVKTYRVWTKKEKAGKYEDVPGFCKSATLEEVRDNDYLLMPSRYVGVAMQEELKEPFEEKMRRLIAQLHEQEAESARLFSAIAKELKVRGYGK